MLIKRCEKYHLPFPFCGECKEFSPWGNGCLRDTGCKAAVKLYRKYTRKGKEVSMDEPLQEDELCQLKK